MTKTFEEIYTQEDIQWDITFLEYHASNGVISAATMEAIHANKDNPGFIPYAYCTPDEKTSISILLRYEMAAHERIADIFRNLHSLRGENDEVGA